MELPEIKLLLSKYEEGETSLREEQRIKELLQKHKDDPSLLAYQHMFSFFEEERNVTLPNNDHKVEQKRPSVFWFVGIAASIAILIGVFISNNNAQKEEELGTYENPEIAMQKTKEVLHLVSRYMNSGAEDLKYLNEFEKTKNKIITIK